MFASADTDPYPAGTVWTLSLDEPIPAVAPLIEVAFQQAGPEALPALAPAMDPGALADFRKRLEAGRRLYAAWSAGQIAAYGWVSYEQEFVGELNLRLKLLPDEAYIWDCLTLPAYRQKHLYSALLGHILRELRTGPTRQVWIGADKDNLPSQRGIARAGFHPVADLVVARGSAQRIAWLTGWPGVPENLVAEARRVFLDNRERVWLDALSPADTGS